MDQPAREPSASEDNSFGSEEPLETKHFKFARSSIEADSERPCAHPRKGTINETNGYNDNENDDDEGLNMDFMQSLNVVVNLAK